ncbi:SAM-dependent methyltransferase [Betaproteobacteria bacterium]|nr:SAM-dependent methyltransferase [Betaproteobacteria bacterium]
MKPALHYNAGFVFISGVTMADFAQLSTPDADARAHSARLLALLRAEIEAAGGWIPFSRYMELALYAPGLGYYSAGARKFGSGGDFITAPELTPLFGQALAGQVDEILRACVSASAVIEIGAGSGLLAVDLLLELERRGNLPERYAILELSAELRARQQETLNSRAPHLAARVHWLDALPESFSGVVVANEVLDAMPAHLVSIRAHAEGVFERGVTLAPDAAALRWADRPAQGAVLEAARSLALPRPEAGEYLTEINLAARGWVRTWAERLGQGALLLIDYGYPRAEFYLPSRANGTLRCYYRHHVLDDPLWWPGLVDITASVDFTAIAEAGFDAGLEVLGFTHQAQFLFNCGVLDCLARRGPQDSADYLRAAQAVGKLTLPQEMGELFKVIALGRGVEAPLSGFARGDRVHTL